MDRIERRDSQGRALVIPSKSSRNDEESVSSSGVRFQTQLPTHDRPKQVVSTQSNTTPTDFLSHVVVTEYEGYQIRKSDAVKLPGLPRTWEDAVVDKLPYTKAKLIEMANLQRRLGSGDAVRDVKALKSLPLIHFISELVKQRNGSEQHPNAIWTLASVEAVRKERRSRRGQVREIDFVNVVLRREPKLGTQDINTTHQALPALAASEQEPRNPRRLTDSSITINTLQTRVSPGEDVPRRPQKRLSTGSCNPGDALALPYGEKQQESVPNPAATAHSSRRTTTAKDPPSPTRRWPSGTEDLARRRDAALARSGLAITDKSDTDKSDTDKSDPDISDDSLDPANTPFDNNEAVTITPLSSPPYSPKELVYSVGKPREPRVDASSEKRAEVKRDTVDDDLQREHLRKHTLLAEDTPPPDPSPGWALARRNEPRHRDCMHGKDDTRGQWARHYRELTREDMEEADMLRRLPRRSDRESFNDEDGQRIGDDYGGDRAHRHPRRDHGPTRRYSSPANEYYPRRALPSRPQRRMTDLDVYEADRGYEGGRSARARRREPESSR